MLLRITIPDPEVITVNTLEYFFLAILYRCHRTIVVYIIYVPCLTLYIIMFPFHQKPFAKRPFYLLYNSLWSGFALISLIFALSLSMLAVSSYFYLK